MNIGDLPAQLFSPAKLVYIAYIVTLVFREPAKMNYWELVIEFVVASLLFLGIEIWHSDKQRGRNEQLPNPPILFASTKPAKHRVPLTDSF